MCVVFSCQLLFVDGSIAAGLVEAMLPHVGSNPIARAMRSVVVAVLQVVFSWTIVRWLVLRHLFGVLVCLVQPKSEGKYSFDDNGRLLPGRNYWLSSCYSI